MPAVCLALVVAVWFIYGQTRHHDFVNFDDNEYVYENDQIRKGLSPDNVVLAFTSTQVHNWHPLTTLSNMLDVELYGLAPGGHHLTSVLLHAATAILLFVLLRTMTGALWPSAFAAAPRETPHELRFLGRSKDTQGSGPPLPIGDMPD